MLDGGVESLGNGSVKSTSGEMRTRKQLSLNDILSSCLEVNRVSQEASCRNFCFTLHTFFRVLFHQVGKGKTVRSVDTCQSAWKESTSFSTKYVSCSVFSAFKGIYTFVFSCRKYMSAFSYSNLHRIRCHIFLLHSKLAQLQRTKLTYVSAIVWQNR